MGPWINLAAFFERVIEKGAGNLRPDGHMTEIVGMVDGSSTLPVALQFETVFCLVLASDGAIGTRKIVAQFIAPNDEVIDTAENELDLVGIGVAMWRWKLSGVTTEFGTYWVEVRLGGSTIARAPLEFRLE
jgi:hypothetical protein